MAVLFEEAYWRNSQLSVARFCGGINITENGKKREFLIVNKQGITLQELSDPDSKHYVKDGMAIPPGEPADLIDKEFIPLYKKLGREKFIDILSRQEQGLSKAELKKRIASAL